MQMTGLRGPIESGGFGENGGFGKVFDKSGRFHANELA